jgi:hypothetical protein
MGTVGKEVYMYILGALIVLGLFIVIGLLIFVPMPKENEQVLLVLLGALTAKFADVVGYFYGSSKSSADKSEVMAKTADKLAEKITP